ncbi:MAG: U32 family peptidase [Candidatus Diapherotrites archaeon]|nr:U32 family peptidase [Candidatus Diapherotrites archaeon]
MNISAPTNWDLKLINFTEKLNKEKSCKIKTAEFYGSLKKSITGSANAPELLKSNISKEHVEKFIKESKKKGFDFNYVINSSCLGNKEYLKKTRKEILDYLNWIESTGASYVTVANPFIMDLVKNSTNLKITLSCVTNPKNINKMKLFENEGIDRIVISTDLNRNFSALKKIKENINCKLEILANESCLLGCPYRAYHHLISSHASQKTTSDQNFDYCLIKCSLARLNDASQIIKAPWIRPEDLDFYSEFNFEFLKLSGRAMPTNWIKNCLQAYSKFRYDGNLYDIIDQRGMYSKEFSRHAKSDNFGKLNIFVDNNKLNNFIENIKKLNVDCGQDCGKCNHCKTTAKKAVKINEKDKKEHIKNLEAVLKKAMFT